MQKCLGIYIENNLIKYAKVSKEKEIFKIESFGVRFYENLNSEIEKIIEETFSFNTVISINLANEKYLYFDVFALLNKKEIGETVKTEFETYCEEKKYNTNVFESRHTLMTNEKDQDKIRALNIYVNKIELNKQMQLFDGYKLTEIVPISIAIGNIAKLNKKENQLIVNMEESTTITTICDKQIYNVETLDIGSKEVLEGINKVENSYSKAYEICKNTTIYTADIETTGEEQPYLQLIVPTIYKIAQKVEEIVNENPSRFQTVYLTGTLASVNNIDLYFQEFLPNVECKILKPSFLEESSTKINTKEYIEVNSAIALATMGLGEGVQELNFKKVTGSDKLLQMFKTQSSTKNGRDLRSKKDKFFDLRGKIDHTEVWLIRAIVALILISVIFTTFSSVLTNAMQEKQNEIESSIREENTQIAAIESNTEALSSKTIIYQQKISDLKKLSEKISDIAESKNSVPNLLNQIANAIPEKVQLISISNTTDKHIVINAQAPTYQQLGYFIAALRTKNILKNVVSSSGVKNGDMVSVTIEGELP